MKHRLVPVSREPDGFDTRTGWRCAYCGREPDGFDTRTGWRCAYCGKQWQEIDANAWFEDCPQTKEP